MKLAIVVGHNSASQGAVRQDTGESEFVWNGEWGVNASGQIDYSASPKLGRTVAGVVRIY